MYILVCTILHFHFSLHSYPHLHELSDRAHILQYFFCLAALGTTEGNTKLSAVLDQLSEVYLKVEKVHEEQSKVLM